MAKKNPIKTPKSKIKNALRKLWLQSRERQSACKRDQYTCQRCGVKQSRAAGREVFIEVHHKNRILNWEKIYEAVYQHLLTHPDNLEVLCVNCHKKEDIDNEL